MATVENYIQNRMGQSVENHQPETCKCCGEKLSGTDDHPYRHQIVEIPPIELEIVEHRLHQLECNHCGAKTRAKLPENIPKSGYGATVVALVSLMSGVYRHSHRMVFSAMSDFFGVKMSLGMVNRLRKEVSVALSVAVEEAKTYIQSAPIVNADETGFSQGNTDSKNPLKKKAWLWVAVTPLAETTAFEIGSRENTPWAKTVRTCRQLLKVETALWLFVEVEDVEPTNNSAERAIRPAVLWKKNSFGSQSENGSIFVARILTVVREMQKNKVPVNL